MTLTLNHETELTRKKKSQIQLINRAILSRAEAYDKQKEELAQQTLFEKSIVAQLDVSSEELRDQMPLTHTWGN